MSAGASTEQPSPFVLVPGFWLGAWAWEEVASHLEAAGAAVRAVTLPGLEGPGSPRAHLRLADAVDAVLDVLRETGPAVLVGHSGAASVVAAISAREPSLVRRAVYVDAWPTPDGMAIMPDLPAGLTEVPLPTEAQLEDDGNSLEGLGEHQRARFRALALPTPAGYARDGVRWDGPIDAVPTTLVLTSATPQQLQEMVGSGHPFFAALDGLDVDYVHLPTGHWPMWSRPEDLAAVLLSATARSVGGAA